MQQFVCVRIVQANSMDLSLFQFDYDLTFAAFFLNADRTIYGRYGSRSSDDAADDMSIDGLRQALAGALELHNAYPANKASLGAKRGKTPRFKTPEEYPALQGKYKSELDYAGNVARSCMHCHQVRDAERMVFRSAGRTMPDEVFYPFPMPDVVGLTLDPDCMATITNVRRESPADRAGFQAGDEIAFLDGQPILSIADVQWVLQNTAAPATLEAQVLRQGEKRRLAVVLARGWRAGDISWRTTTWDLRRMGTGGLLLEELPAADRRQAQLADSELALRVKHVGEYGEHAAAKRAGFQKGDIIIDLDGRTSRMTESELLAYTVQKKMPGDAVSVTVLRGDKRVELQMPVQ